MPLNVLLVGAGEINFGSVEGPWNHTLRLERKLGTSLTVVALVDPDVERATAALSTKLKGSSASSYLQCEIFSTVQTAANALSEANMPKLIILGAPPSVRGSDIPGRDLEIQIIGAFPGSALFVEKPLSNGLEDACQRVARRVQQARTLVSVGYMLRYSQGDLSRYFGGDIRLPSIAARTVEHNEPAGFLSAKRFDEDNIPPDNRLPRLTSATWKYINGAVGSLTHAIVLHGTLYDTEFEVYADGYRLKLIDPYNAPILSVRRPGITYEEIFKFTDDDPFFTEMSSMIDAIDHPEAQGAILSSYEDAVKTHEFTWHIRRSSEAAARAEREQGGSTAH
ncbi:uncharacterized protein FIBRA_07649 [Fibroporia radiculosa]|uniref:Gfo/Idh/MocA-like oxidoreductase N-terminal domain-containing protein n=1 Tax=Fibroporia radiculosa TaxID=599839 RepID=J4I127_9APHY|nr:uncharacterized protein FIBRA_07649 [Fibroporia radiculosa]CCM05432.1 predicted protein [Fibroporia radiculosa]